jgi:organic hydroperoxide reductase OsmC/OhrA
MSHAQHEHEYRVEVVWTGNKGQGTSNYKAYSRDHLIHAGAKPSIDGSSDPAFRGDGGRWNPEELLVAALSACHKLWYLHLCAEAGVRVVAYRDQALGRMIEEQETGGRFVGVLLRPTVEVRTGDDLVLARDLHHKAHKKCFIANSVNFPVEIEPNAIEAV